MESFSFRAVMENFAAFYNASEADPATVNNLRWFGIAVVAFGVAVIFLRWWRNRN